MPATSSYSPIKIVSDLGIVEPWDIDSELDYLNALKEGINTLQVENSSDNRIPVLQEEVKRLRKQKFKPTIKKISAEAFKKGSSVGGAQKVSADTTGASALALRRSSLSPNVQPSGQEGIASPLQPVVESIAGNVDSIHQTLIDKEKYDKKTANKSAQQAEAKKRNLRESLLESKSFKGLMKGAMKILSPVKSMFDRVVQFLTTIIMGNVVLKLISWWGDPKNKSKVKSIINFVKDWWPALTAAVLLFGTSFGGIVSGLIVSMTTVWIPKMLMAIVTMMKNPWVAAAVLGGVGIYGIGKMLGKDKVVENETERANTSRTALEQSESTKDLSAGDREALVQGTRLQDAGGPGSLNNMTNQFTDPLGLRNDPLGGVKFNKGGSVTGPSGVDKVPARLTAGEFVMSKGAVNRWGAGTFAAMNSFGGGRNTGSYSGGYNEGGEVKNIAVGMRDKILLFKSIIESPEVQSTAETIGSLFRTIENQSSTVNDIESSTTREIPSPPVTKDKPIIITPEIPGVEDMGGSASASSEVPLFSVVPTDGGMSQKVKVLGFVR